MFGHSGFELLNFELQELEQLGLTALNVGLGGADVTLPANQPPSAATIQATLSPLGFDLLEDSRD